MKLGRGPPSLIFYIILKKYKKAEILILIDSESKMNTINPAYATKLNL